MDGDPKLESLGETLDKLTAHPELCATLTFPVTGLTLTLNSVGDGQWNMVAKSKTRGVFDVAKLDEETLRFRIAAADVVESIAGDITAERAAPKVVSDLEAMLSAEAQP
jgi:hypothetical protein